MALTIYTDDEAIAVLNDCLGEIPTLANHTFDNREVMDRRRRRVLSELQGVLEYMSNRDDTQ